MDVFGRARLGYLCIYYAVLADLWAAGEFFRSLLVIEAASNDGYMLRHFVVRDIPALGIDPAKGPVSAALKRGVPTLHTFFTLGLAQRLFGQHKRADVFLANNVLAHVADIRGFVDGVTLLLKDDGVFVVEVPYVLDLIEHCEFDTVYHQHLCYFSLTALDRLFRDHALFLNDLQHTTISRRIVASIRRET